LASCSVFIYLSPRLLQVWQIMPGAGGKVRRIASIGLHLLLVVAQRMLAVLIIDHPASKLSNTWDLSIIVPTMSLYGGGCAGLYLLSQQIKPRRLDW